MQLDYLSSPITPVKMSNMTIARLLSDHFRDTGEKQAEFARRVGLTPQTVIQLARGDIKVPTADIRRRLARAFRLRHVDILVMTGELAADELPAEGAPRPVRDDRLRALADNWDQMTDTEHDFLMVVLDRSLRRRGEEGIDNLARVVDGRPERRAAG